MLPYCVPTVSGFNPRPREGATVIPAEAILEVAGFNPRPREGATADPLTDINAAKVSIHAPVKGRRTVFGQDQADKLFQSTPP